MKMTLVMLVVVTFAYSVGCSLVIGKSHADSLEREKNSAVSAYRTAVTAIGLVNGVGFTSFSLVVSLLDGVAARIGLSVLFGITLGFGLHGFWWGTVIASYVSVVIPGIYFLSGLWKKRKLLTEKI